MEKIKHKKSSKQINRTFNIEDCEFSLDLLKDDNENLEKIKFFLEKKFPISEKRLSRIFSNIKKKLNKKIEFEFLEREKELVTLIFLIFTNFYIGISKK